MDRNVTVSGYDTAVKPRVVTQIDLIEDLKPGDTIQIVTASGAKYWITATREACDAYSQRTGATVRGFSVQTTSKTVAGFAASPSETIIGRYVNVGQPFALGRIEGHTSHVRSIRKL